VSDSLANQVKKIVAHIRSGTPNKKDVVVGPVVQRPDGGSMSVEWYFVFAHESDGEVHYTALGADERKLAKAFRTKLITTLRAAKFTPHNFDDDLALAQMADALWPSERTKRILDGVVAERAEQLSQERMAWGVDAVMEQRPLTAAEIALFGLDAEAAKKFFALDSESAVAGSGTIYFRLVDVDVDGTLVPAARPYIPP
jgi:hypothetical protein